MKYREWFDLYARHMADTELYAEARASLSEETLERMCRELQDIIRSYGTIKGRATEAKCRKECDRCIERYLRKWSRDEEEERKEFAKREAAWIAASVLSAFGIAAAVSAVRLGRALESPHAGSSFGTLKDDIGHRAKKSVRQSLLSARIFGSPASSAADGVASDFEKMKKGIAAETATAVTGLQRSVAEQTLAGSGLRFLYVSMLDDRTCAVCAGYSGNVYESLAKAPDIPVHMRCRCYYLPVMPGEEIPETESYGDWFRRQPDSVKYRILGPSRYSFYKGGLTDIKAFSSKGRKLTLKELFGGKKKERKPSRPESKVWHREKVSGDADLYVAQERLEAGMKDPAVYASDRMMAKTLARETGKDVYLLPENKKNSANPDGFFNGGTIEFKHVIGKRDKIGKNAVRGLEQSENVFLYIEKNFGIDDCVSKVKGSIKARINESKKEGSKPFDFPDMNRKLYIYTQGKLYVFNWGDVWP